MAVIRIPGEGTTYATVEELEASIRDLEEAREAEVSGLRAQGLEGKADRKDDAYRAAIRRRQERLRALQERAAKKTPQPRNRPEGTRTPKRPGGRRRGGGHPVERSVDEALGVGRAARRDVERFGGTTGLDEPIGGAADLAWAFVGIAVALPLVYALITGKGPATVERLAGAFETGVGRFLDPHDAFLLAARPEDQARPSGLVAGDPLGNYQVGDRPGPDRGGAVGAGGVGHGGPGGAGEHGGGTLDKLFRWARRFGLVVTEVNTPGEHVAGSYHYRNRAIDVKTGPALERFARFAHKHPRLITEFFWPGDWFIKDGRIFPAGAHDYVPGGGPDHYDHGHIAI